MSEVNCSECDHDVDLHSGTGNWCVGCFEYGTDGDELCDLAPSDVARALVASVERFRAEPTEAEVEAGGRALWMNFSGQGSTPWRDLADTDRDEMCEEARAVLRAARGLS